MASNLYSIESYGADYSVEHIYMMYERGDLEIPDFQRRYVWNIKQASRFIESCIIGLPIPSFFLFKEQDSSKYLVVDGQQRIQSLIFFKKGYFKDERTSFKLSGVAQEYDGCTYEELPPNLRRRFDYAILRLTIFQQAEPEGGMESVYEVFSRLNSGGLKLTAHEVRNAIFRGKINGFLQEVNLFGDWRALYGKKTPDIHMKDEELILRFLALSDDLDSYEAPMNEFLNSYMDRHKDADDGWFVHKRQEFEETASLIYELFGKEAFRLKNTLNSAMCDSLMVTFAKQIGRRNELVANKVAMKKRYSELVKNEEYMNAVETGTSQNKKVRTRIDLADYYLFNR